MTGRNMKTGGAYVVQFGKILLVAATNLYGGLVFCKSSKVRNTVYACFTVSTQAG